METATTRTPLRIGFLSDTGRARAGNEDAYAVWIPTGEQQRASTVSACVAVADGMGGHDAGEVASRLAVETIRDAFAGPEALDFERGKDLLAWLEVLFQLINRRLTELAHAQQLARGTGCTLTVGVLLDGHLHLAHVGDSRCYRLRDGALEQLTRDHSWVAEQRRAGLLTEAEERDHPQRNLLTRSLGMSPPPEVDLAELPVQPGDRYLLCSDGLHGLIDDPTLAAVLLQESSPQAAVERLVGMANGAGGYDNITAVLLEIAPSGDAETVRVAPVPAALGDTQPLSSLPTPPQRRVVGRGLIGVSSAALVIGALGLVAWWGGLMGNSRHLPVAGAADSLRSPALLQPLHADSSARSPPPGAATAPPSSQP